MIPKKLSDQDKDRIYKTLIHGFVRNVEKEHDLCYNVPFYLKEIIRVLLHSDLQNVE